MNRLLTSLALVSTLLATVTGCASSTADEPNEATGDAFSLVTKTTIEDGFYGDGTGNFVRVLSPLVFGAQSFDWAVGMFNTGRTSAASMTGDTVTGSSTHGGGTVEIKADGAGIAFRSITTEGATDIKLVKTSTAGFYADPTIPRLQFQLTNVVGNIADMEVYDNTAPVYHAMFTGGDAPMVLNDEEMCGHVSLSFEGAKGGLFVRFVSTPLSDHMSPDCNEIRTLAAMAPLGARLVRYK